MPKDKIEQSIKSALRVCFEFNTTINFQKHIQNSHLSKKDTAQKMKFSIEDFFSKCDQIRRKLRFGHICGRNP